MKAYSFCLYVVPHDEELTLAPLKRTRWNKNVDLFHSQYKLSDYIDAVESLKFVNRNNIGDTVLVVQSNRPLFDVLFFGTPEGEAKAWLGSLISNDVTNSKDAKFNSIDGLFYRRVELVNAKPVPKELLKKWSAGEIERIYSRLNFTHHDAVEELKGLGLGSQDVLIYDQYQNTDIYCINHILSKDEKKADLVEDSDSFSIKQKYWGSDKVYGQLRSALTGFASGVVDVNSKNPSSMVLCADDSRSPQEIYSQIQSLIEPFFEAIKKNYPRMRGNVVILKHLSNNLSTLDKSTIESAISYEKMLKYKLLETGGLEITSKTMLAFSCHSSNGRPLENAVYDSFYSEVSEILPSYSLKKISFSFGYGGSLTENQQIDLDPFFFDLDHYYGERKAF